MRVLVSGGSGVLGKRLIRLLHMAGHEALGMVRSETGAEIVTAAGGQPLRVSLFDADQIIADVESCDVIIHAATAIPKTQSPSPEDWKPNDRIRTEGTQTLIDVARRTGAEQFIFQSIAWVARPDDQSPFSEDSPLNPDYVTQSAIDGEKITMQSADEHGFIGTVLRGGTFYSADGWHTQMFRDALCKRRMPIIGSGEARWSNLHVDDAASAYLAAIQAQISGIYNVVDDKPSPVGEYLTYFAGRLGAKRPFRIPVWLARLVAGEGAVRFVTTSTITDAERFKSATGWQPEYPDYRAGLDQIVSEWEREDA